MNLIKMVYCELNALLLELMAHCENDWFFVDLSTNVDEFKLFSSTKYYYRNRVN